MKLVLLHLFALLAFLVLAQTLECTPPKIEYCNACQDPNIISESALKDCKPGYHIVEGFCQTIKTRRSGPKCLPDERKTSDGSCRKKKRAFKRCPHILEPKLKRNAVKRRP
ncbi:uncharacterized protein DMAD_11536 [Drosophila madeirensis]|uniref:Seminal fluid protein n=1 Tax=Drosophila madeirensis TaxID=30013 RepID=A0AAU9FDN0_DROMD